MILSESARVLFQWLGLLVCYWFQRLRHPFDSRRAVARVARRIQRLGPVWVRAVKLEAAAGAPLFGANADEFAFLEDAKVTTSTDANLPRLSASLGRPWHEIFQEFEEAPFAANAFFQEHRARLLQADIEVTVKVRRANAAALAHRDARALRFLARLLTMAGWRRDVRWTALCDELDEALVHELDLRFEKAALAKLRSLSTSESTIVPQVFDELSSETVLVTERIDAPSLRECLQRQRENPAAFERWMEENDIRPRILAMRLFESTFARIFENNLFPAGVALDDVLVLEGSRIAIRSCAVIGTLDTEMVAKFHIFFRALADSDFSLAVDTYLLLFSKLPRIDLMPLKQKMIRQWRQWEARNYVAGLPAEQKSIFSLLVETATLLYGFGFRVEWPLAQFCRAMADLEQQIAILHPGMCRITHLEKYFQEAKRRMSRVKPDLAWRSGLRAIASADAVMPALPAQLMFEQALGRQEAMIHQAQSSLDRILLAFGFRIVRQALGVSILALLLLAGLRIGARQLEVLLGGQITGVLLKLPAVAGGAWTLILASLVVLCWISSRIVHRLESGAASVYQPAKT
jgi:ubiquinone biosynthesis protein